MATGIDKAAATAMRFGFESQTFALLFHGTRQRAGYAPANGTYVFGIRE